MLKTSGLTARQHQREGIEMPVELVICDEHAAQLRFSPSAESAAMHTIRARGSDISPGGMGLECRQYLPRMTEGTIRVFYPKPTGNAPDGSAIYEVAFEHRVKVRRVWLTDRQPTYAIGLAFVNPDPGIDQVVMRLLDRLRNSTAAKSADRGGEAARA